MKTLQSFVNKRHHEAIGIGQIKEGTSKIKIQQTMSQLQLQRQASTRRFSHQVPKQSTIRIKSKKRRNSSSSNSSVSSSDNGSGFYASSAASGALGRKKSGFSPEKVGPLLSQSSQVRGTFANMTKYSNSKTYRSVMAKKRQETIMQIKKNRDQSNKRLGLGITQADIHSMNSTENSPKPQFAGDASSQRIFKTNQTKVSGKSDGTFSKRSLEDSFLESNQSKLRTTKKRELSKSQKEQFQKQFKGAQKKLIQRLIEKEMTKQNKCSELIVISTSNSLYQVWKLFVILFSFLSSLNYAYYATFFKRMSPAEKQDFDGIDWFFQIFFICDMVLNFFIEYHYPSSAKVERDMGKLFLIYLKGRFFIDIITVIPYTEITEMFIADFAYGNFLYLLKLIRLLVVFDLLNYKIFMKQIKIMYEKKAQTLLHQKKELAEDQSMDHNNISTILLISHILKTSQLVLILLCISFFTGLLWYIFCDFQSELMWWRPTSTEAFLTDTGILVESTFNKMITLTYFAFTTLSTVGLGDFHPVSSMERLFGALIMLFGVAITTYVIENLTGMLNQIRNFGKTFEQTSELSQFMKTLERFNDNSPLDKWLHKGMEDYFNYRWSHNQNLAVSTQKDFDLLDQLPKLVQNQIYTDFLFKRFLNVYSSFFKGLTGESFYASTIIKKTPQTMSQLLQDENFKDFLTAILQVLEPKQLENNSLFQRQNQEVDEVIFLMSGQFKVGYNHEFFMLQTVNERIKKQAFKNLTREYTELFGKGTAYKRKVTKLIKRKHSLFLSDKLQIQKFHYPILFNPGQTVGFFEMAFNQKSHFLYRTIAHEGGRGRSDCLFIRLSSWVKVLEEQKHLEATIDKFKNRILIDYLNNIYFPTIDFQEASLLQGNEKKIMEREANAQSVQRNCNQNPKLQKFLTRKIGGNVIEVSSCDEETDSQPSVSITQEDEEQYYKDQKKKSSSEKSSPVSHLNIARKKTLFRLVTPQAIPAVEEERRVKFFKEQMNKMKTKNSGRQVSSGSSKSADIMINQMGDVPPSPPYLPTGGSSTKRGRESSPRRFEEPKWANTLNLNGQDPIIQKKEAAKIDHFLLSNQQRIDKPAFDDPLLKKFQSRFKSKMMVDLFKVKLKGRILHKLEDGLAGQVRNIWRRKVKDDTMKLLIRENLSFMKLKVLLDQGSLNQEDIKKEKKLARQEERKKFKIKNKPKHQSSSESSSSYSSSSSEGCAEDEDENVLALKIIEGKLEEAELNIHSLLTQVQTLEAKLINSEYKNKKLQKLLLKGGTPKEIGDVNLIAQFALSDKISSESEHVMNKIELTVRNEDDEIVSQSSNSLRTSFRGGKSGGVPSVEVHRVNGVDSLSLTSPRPTQPTRLHMVLSKDIEMGEGLQAADSSNPSLERGIMSKRKFHSHFNVGEGVDEIQLQSNIQRDHSEPGHKSSRVDDGSKITMAGIGLSANNDESMLSQIEFEQYKFTPVKLAAIAEQPSFSMQPEDLDAAQEREQVSSFIDKLTGAIPQGTDRPRLDSSSAPPKTKPLDNNIGYDQPRIFNQQVDSSDNDHFEDVQHKEDDSEKISSLQVSPQQYDKTTWKEWNKLRGSPLDGGIQFQRRRLSSDNNAGTHLSVDQSFNKGLATPGAIPGMKPLDPQVEFNEERSQSYDIRAGDQEKSYTTISKISKEKSDMPRLISGFGSIINYNVRESQSGISRQISNDLRHLPSASKLSNLGGQQCNSPNARGSISGNSDFKKQKSKIDIITSKPNFGSPVSKKDRAIGKSSAKSTTTLQVGLGISSPGGVDSPSQTNLNTLRAPSIYKPPTIAMTKPNLQQRRKKGQNQSSIALFQYPKDPIMEVPQEAEEPSAKMRKRSMLHKKSNSGHIVNITQPNSLLGNFRPGNTAYAKIAEEPSMTEEAGGEILQDDYEDQLKENNDHQDELSLTDD